MRNFNMRYLPTLVLAAALAVVAAPVPAEAQDPGPPSGNGIQPVWVADNPDCGDLGYGFGFKLEGSPEGTFHLVSGEGSLTGGAPQDPGNSVTVSNSDGQFFDWTATLGVDAVIVKAGPNADVFPYDPESTGDTVLHGPVNPNNGTIYAVSHIELCYDYEVSVAKDAETAFTRTFAWGIEKTANPAQWWLFEGDTGTSRYTVTVTKTGFTDSDWAVTGSIWISNDTPLDALIVSVSDLVSPALGVPVDCGVSFPYLLASGEELHCTYSRDLPDGSSRVNTATVTTGGIVGGGDATADVVFDEPTTVVHGTVTVSDTNGGSWQFSDTGSVTYDRTFACGGDQGVHGNTATIVETGQHDSAAVTVNCYDLQVTKDAATTFTRTWAWTVDKSADQTELLLAPGQSFDVHYEVLISATSQDSDWAVSGAILIANPNPVRAAPLTAVGDLLSGGVTGTVECPALAVPAGGSLTCTYTADLPDGAGRTNTATATLENFAFDPAGGAAPSGTTDFSGEAAAVFGDPTEEIDECADVTDTLAGDLGTVCAADAPMVFMYSHTVGPYQAPEDCGEQTVDNTAAFEAEDSGTTGDDSWTVNVFVACGEGCTLTPGYWKTHSPEGPAPLDETWFEVGPDAEDTPFFASGQTWYEVLWTPARGNAYYILARAYIAASMNFLNGASAPVEVLDAWNEATDLFETYTPAEIGALKGNRPPRPRFLELAGLLDMYNNGDLGPGHCSEDTTSAP